MVKPFTEETLLAILRNLENSKQLHSESEKANGYVPVYIDSLVRIRRLDAPLFLKLSDQNFVQVLHAGSEFREEELERFRRKNIQKLLIEFSNYNNFILAYKKEVLSREAWKDLADSEAAYSLALDHQLIMEAGKKFGWSESTVNLAVSNIKQVTKLIERNPDLRQVVVQLTKEKHSRLSTLSVLLAVACTAIVQELGWDSETTRQKLVFASLLHDMELNEDLFTTMMTLLQESEVSDLMKDPSAQVILEHPVKTAEMLLNWPLCPPDVDVIIRQHHERPDGKGFPFGLEAFRISNLAAVMIVAEDVIFHSVDNLGVDPKTYLESRKEFYARGEFKKIHEAAVRSLGRT